MSAGTSPTGSFKKMVKDVPLLARAVRKFAEFPLFSGAQRRAFPGSAAFWEKRYRDGGNSGSGSYGRVAAFKAEVLNDFVRTKEVRNVIEFGCGDGAQLQLAKYPEYVGIDVATVPIQICSRRFTNDQTKRFYLSSSVPPDLGPFDLALSLEVIFHLVEDAVFDSYMRALFAASGRFVAIFSSNYEAQTSGAHVRHRRFTDWISQDAPSWESMGVVPNRFPFDPNRPNDTSFSDFYFFARRRS